MDMQTQHWLRLYLTDKLSEMDWAVIQQQEIDFKQLAQSNNPRIQAGLKACHQVILSPHLKWLEAGDCHIIPWYHNQYPQHLKQIKTPPPFLFVKGQPSHLSNPQLAIVGSRKASPAALNLTKRFSQQLGDCGLTITSGLAHGIDGAAHQSAVDHDNPTIAVLASGLDIIYPKHHHSLAKKILNNGCLVSEMPLGTALKPYLFPRRNRIISGLSLGTLVAEAAIRSGSLITARLAAEQNREVFAIPGAITNPQTAGCHQLIQQGAKLVTCIEDICDELPGIASIPTQNTLTDIPLLSIIDFDPTDFDTIVCRSKLTACQVSSMLSLLEIQGHIQTCPGGYCRVK